MAHKPSVLMVQLIDPQTGEVHKVHGCRWITAGNYEVLVESGELDPSKYLVTYERLEVL